MCTLFLRTGELCLGRRAAVGALSALPPRHSREIWDGQILCAHPSVRSCAPRLTSRTHASDAAVDK
jgi:hypothetical protein